MENNFIHESSYSKKSNNQNSKSESIRYSFENKSAGIHNPNENNNTSNMVSKIYTHTPSRNSQEDYFMDDQQKNIVLHEIKIDKNENRKAPNDFRISPKNDDKISQLITKIDEFINSQSKANAIQQETNAIQRETNSILLNYIKNQEELNKEIFNYIKDQGKLNKEIFNYLKKKQ